MASPSRTLTLRTMAIPYADLERIPEVIAVAGGEPKTEALRAVLRGSAAEFTVSDPPLADPDLMVYSGYPAPL